MNRARVASVGLGALIVVGSMTFGGAATAAPDDPVTFEPQIQACVNAALGQDAKAPITQSQAAGLESLECRGGTFTELTGIEYLTSVTSLDISDGTVTDIRPIEKMPALTTFTARNMRRTLPDIPVGEWQPNVVRTINAWANDVVPGFVPPIKGNYDANHEAWRFTDAHDATDDDPGTLDWRVNNWGSPDRIQYVFTGVVMQNAVWLPPTVQDQPSLPSAVLAGTTVELTSTATSNQTPTVQWQVRTPGEDWTDIAGATATTYSWAPSAAEDGNEYRAVFTTGGGTAESNIVALHVGDAATYTSQPTSQTASVGGDAEFRAEFTSDSARPNYTWEYSTDGGATWQDTDTFEAQDNAADEPEENAVAAASNDWYTVLDLTGVTQDMDGWLFRAVVWDEFTDPRIVSDAASLTVSAAAGQAADPVAGGSTPTVKGTSKSARNLAQTGTDTMPFVIGALALIGVGGGVLFVRHRRAGRAAA